MNKHPHLTFIPPKKVPPKASPRGGSKIHKATANQQFGRFKRKFEELSNQFSEFSSLQQSTEGVVPEKVLVIEVVGSIQNFERAIKKAPGLELLRSSLGEEVEDELVYFLDKDDEPSSSTTTLYLTMSSYKCSGKLNLAT